MLTKGHHSVESLWAWVQILRLPLLRSILSGFTLQGAKVMQIHFVFQQGNGVSFGHTLSSLTHTSSVPLCKHQLCWYVGWVLKKLWINKLGRSVACRQHSYPTQPPPSQPAHRTITYREYYISCCINTIWPPDDEPRVFRNVYRIIIINVLYNVIVHQVGHLNKIASLFRNP